MQRICGFAEVSSREQEDGGELVIQLERTAEVTSGDKIIIIVKELPVHRTKCRAGENSAPSSRALFCGSGVRISSISPSDSTTDDY